MNLFGLADGDNIHSDFRREFARQADDAKRDVELVHVLNGGFLDRGVLFGFLGAIDLAKDEANLWGGCLAQQAAAAGSRQAPKLNCMHP